MKVRLQGTEGGSCELVFETAILTRPSRGEEVLELRTHGGHANALLVFLRESYPSVVNPILHEAIEFGKDCGARDLLQERASLLSRMELMRDQLGESIEAVRSVGSKACPVCGGAEAIDDKWCTACGGEGKVV